MCRAVSVHLEIRCRFHHFLRWISSWQHRRSRGDGGTFWRLGIFEI